ncbi:YihY/virulence factor BrkB family protein [Kitasatospora sp. NBC_01287]|uniref:YihY/virulence factor BrkB family protein n=1 Tax=Kitasatospora sp. NBC_01287 TaxID=2903573 RepID=UPI002255E08C|nr:YhjD/YihY/BrkB family envelope integrity protein [Kitasatospora sp. NBC_01287]MCX4748583.1 YihY/virulence factor BrkB family protein [Kitasatospora sp. NBC_01287]
MGFLTRLPVIGPLAAVVLRSRPYRVYEHFTAAKANRLAGAVTFFGFLALFPLLTVALAIAVATLTPARVDTLKNKIADQVPGLAHSLDLDSLVANAATVGALSGLLLLISGLGWVDTMRGAIRDVWQLPEEDGNVVLRKAWDCLVLVGLGAVALVSLGASAVTTRLAGRLATALGLSDHGPAHYLLAAVGFVIAVGADLLLFLYLLAPFPRIADQRRRDLLTAALIGAVGFELLKLLLSSYLGSVAGKSLYGAFGVPVALLLWIDFVNRLLMYCASWTALADPEGARARARASAEAAYRAAGELGAGGAPARG